MAPARRYVVVSAAGFIGAILALSLNGSFRAYPSLIKAAIKGPRVEGNLDLGMGVGVSGLPASMADMIQHFRDVNSRPAELHAAGYRVANLRRHEAWYPRRPRSADYYCPLLNFIISKDQLDQAIKRFERISNSTT